MSARETKDAKEDATETNTGVTEAAVATGTGATEAGHAADHAVEATAAIGTVGARAGAIMSDEDTATMTVILGTREDILRSGNA